MDKESRRQEDDRSAREANEDVEIPEDEVTSLVCVEVSKSNDGAPPCRDVQVVRVRYCARLRAKVEGDTGEDAIGEVPPHFRIIIADRGQDPPVILVEVIGCVLERG